MTERKPNLAQKIILASVAALMTSSQAISYAPAALAKQFELNAEQKDYTPGDNGVPEYAPYPTFTPQKAPKKQPPPKKQILKQQIQQQQAPPLQRQMPQARPMPVLRQSPMFNLGAQRSVPLPPSFLGRWSVQGRKTGFEAMRPEFQAAEGIFSPQTQNTWNIVGNPQQGYAFSNDMGVKSQLIVDKVEGSRAFIRYQHPIKNTVAQEAIVLEIGPDGAQFNGMERITIMKQGEGPRAKVTYSLAGIKQ